MPLRGVHKPLWVPIQAPAAGISRLSPCGGLFIPGALNFPIMYPINYMMRPGALGSLVGGLPRTFWYLWAGMLVNRLGGFLFTFLAIYLTETRGYSIQAAGLYVALYGAGSLLAGPLGGVLADSLGRRPTMLMSACLGALAMLQLGIARDPWHLAEATLLLGLVNDLGRPARQAAVADLVPSADRARAYGLLYWAVNLGKHDILVWALGDPPPLHASLEGPQLALVVAVRVQLAEPLEQRHRLEFRGLPEGIEGPVHVVRVEGVGPCPPRPRPP